MSHLPPVLASLLILVVNAPSLAVAEPTAMSRVPDSVTTSFAPSCVPGPTILCLNGGRFAVDATWRTASGSTGSGRAEPLTADTGYFWFFRPDNVEVVVKVLDACGGFDRFWVFVSGLTDVEVELTVTDTVTGESRIYQNPLGEPFQPVQDTDAFATCSEDSSLGDGMHLLSVPLADGGVDLVYVYVVSPPGDDTDLPVVVYGHGLNHEIANCAPDAGPGGVDSFGPHALNAPPKAEILADAGYLGVVVLYRNKGAGAPGVGTLRLRDHYVRDARALLAAARWARDLHGRGSERVAFLGTSAGTWPAFWAATDRDDLADLQAGLDIRTSILAAETANRITNVSGKLDCSSSPVLNRYQSLQLIAAIAPEPEIRFDDLRADGLTGELADHAYTEKGLDLVEAIHFQPSDPELDGCEGLEGVPPSCDDGACRARTGLALFGGVRPPNDELYPSLMFETAETLCALGPEAIDPGPDTGNPFLDIMRAISPAYAAEGLVTGRALPLLARGDSHYHPAALRHLTEKLASLGAAVPDPPHDLGTECGHLDYLDPAKPQCGYRLIVDELGVAFAGQAPTE